MIIELFAFLTLLAIVLIVVGLVKPQETAQAIIGFLLLFILSMVILTGNLQYETGMLTNLTTTTNVSTGLSVSAITSSYQYTTYNDTTTHNVGYYLAIAASLGMIGTIWSLARTRWSNE